MLYSSSKSRSENGDYSEIKKKSEQFRVKIRKEQKDEYFQERRLQIVNQKQSLKREEKINKIRQTLRTPQDRVDFIERLNLELRGDPRDRWHEVLETLQLMISCYQGDFIHWSTIGVIKALTTTFKQQYLQLALSNKAAIILTDILYLQPRQTTELAQSILDQEPIDDIIALIDNQNLQISDRDIYCGLLANITMYSYKIRDFVSNKGAYRSLVVYGKYLVQNPEQFYRRNYLINLRSFLKVYEFGEKKKIPSTNFVQYLSQIQQIISIIPILVELLMQKGNSKTIYNIMILIYYMAKTGKDNVNSHLIQAGSLLKFLVENINNQEVSDIKHITISILTFLSCSESIGIEMQFVKLGILDQLYICSQKREPELMKKVERNIVLVISNLCCVNKEVCYLVENHAIYNYIIEKMSSNDQNLQKEAFYCVNSLIDSFTFNMFQRALHEKFLLEIVVKNLTDCWKYYPETALEILSVVKKLIQFYQMVYLESMGGKVNKIIDILERIYNFQKLLDTITNHSKHALLQVEASRLIDIFATFPTNSNLDQYQ